MSDIATGNYALQDGVNKFSHTDPLLVAGIERPVLLDTRDMLLNHPMACEYIYKPSFGNGASITPAEQFNQINSAGGAGTVGVVNDSDKLALQIRSTAGNWICSSRFQSLLVSPNNSGVYKTSQNAELIASARMDLATLAGAGQLELGFSYSSGGVDAFIRFQLQKTAGNPATFNLLCGTTPASYESLAISYSIDASKYYHFRLKTTASLIEAFISNDCRTWTKVAEESNVAYIPTVGLAPQVALNQNAGSASTYLICLQHLAVRQNATYQ